jgi:hypothetical protein
VLSAWRHPDVLSGDRAGVASARLRYAAGMSDLLDRLAIDAPDAVDAWRRADIDRVDEIRDRIGLAVGPGSTQAIVAQLAATAAALAELVGALPEPAFALPGGEGDWTVAEAVGHACDARGGLSLAAAMAASGRWPAEAGPVIPGVPGDAGADRDALLRRIASSQRVVERAARSIAGHEQDACPLDHPIVGRLRCGEWLLFAAVHDLTHIEQLEGIGMSA